MFKVWSQTENRYLDGDYVINQNGYIMIGDERCGACDQIKYSTVEEQLILIQSGGESTMNKYQVYVLFWIGDYFANGEKETHEMIMNVEAGNAKEAAEKVKEWEAREDEREVLHYYVQYVNG